MTYNLLSSTSNYRIYRTRSIHPMEEDTDTLIFLFEEEAKQGFKLQTIFYYKSELLIIFTSFQ